MNSVEKLGNFVIPKALRASMLTTYSHDEILVFLQDVCDQAAIDHNLVPDSIYDEDDEQMNIIQ